MTAAARDPLERLRAEARRELAARRKLRQRRRRGKALLRWPVPLVVREAAWLGLRVAIAVLLPFATLVGGGAWSYRLLGLPTWAAIGVAVLLTAGCLALFGVQVAKALSIRYGARPVGLKMGMRIAVPIVAIYCGYALMFVARENAKTDAVRAYFTSVHPLLRVALGTAILADPAIVLTDTRREAGDYAGMALPARQRSLHFTQPDGYVHAVDLRTAGRSWPRVAITRAYFTLLGFETLRHVGTADHLHVSLPVH